MVARDGKMSNHKQGSMCRESAYGHVSEQQSECTIERTTNAVLYMAHNTSKKRQETEDT